MGTLTKEEEESIRVLSQMYGKLSLLVRDYNELKTDPQYIELVERTKDMLKGNRSSQLFKGIQSNLSSIESNYLHINKNETFKTIRTQFTFLWQNFMLIE